MNRHRIKKLLAEGRATEAQQLVRESLAAKDLEPSEEFELQFLRAEVAARLADISGSTESGEEIEAARAALKLARVHLIEDDSELQRAHEILGLALFHAESSSEAEAHLAQAYAMAERLGVRNILAIMAYRDVLLKNGRPELAVAIARVCVAWARRGRPAAIVATELVMLADCLTATGRKAEALACVEELKRMAADSQEGWVSLVEAEATRIQEAIHRLDDASS
jgi:tetratricopeptide (TPR) repeat protein